jgi:sulfite exporter TauE/SafE
MLVGVELPHGWARAAELLVAALLVLLGITVLVRYARGRWHLHGHAHDGTPHFHLHSHAAGPSHHHAHPRWDAARSLGLGLAHGMAGSAAVLVLVVAATPAAAQRVAYLAAFGGGTIAGMLAVSLTLGYLVRLASQRGARLATALHLASAAASVGAGVMLGVEVLF